MSRYVKAPGRNVNDRHGATPGSDVLDGKGYATYAQGNGGADAYAFGTGYGGLRIANGPRLGGGTPAGEVDLNGGVTGTRLWLRQSGNDLEADILGGSDRLTIMGWFGPSPGAQLGAFKAADGRLSIMPR